MSNGYGGKRRNAGRPTTWHREQRPLRPGERAQSVRMLVTEAEYNAILTLTPHQRTLALMFGRAVVQKIEEQENIGGQNERL